MPRPSEQIDRARLQQALQSILSQSMGMAQSLMEEQPPDEPPAANDQPVEVQRRNRSTTLSRKLSKSLRGLASHARPGKRRAAPSDPDAPSKRRAITLPSRLSPSPGRGDVAENPSPADAQHVAPPPSADRHQAPPPARADVEPLAQRFPGIDTETLVGLGDVHPTCDPILRFLLSGESFAQLQRLIQLSVDTPPRRIGVPRILEPFSAETKEHVLSLIWVMRDLGEKRSQGVRDYFSLMSSYVTLRSRREANRPDGLTSSVGGSREKMAKELGIKASTLSDWDGRGHNISLLTGGHLGLLCLFPLDLTHRPILRTILARGKISETATMGAFVESNPFLVQLSSIIQRHVWPVMSGQTSTLPPAVSSLLGKASMWKPEQFVANLARQLGAIEGTPAEAAAAERSQIAMEE
ncbi:hypothetical protein S40288_09877 [Stachybotrys chartarum IBT 40288]|nr:hypothetical protein S40288_09877 [Stachybotrys chartarum IBT 40288]